MYDDGMSAAGRVNIYPELPQFDVVGGWGKRAFDIAFSLLALVALFPLIVAIVLSIRLSSKGSVLFVHDRIGLHGRTFPCLKFRTMVIDAGERLGGLLETDSDARQEFSLYRKLKSDPRVLPGVGSFLRATSLDELPQFINVLLGQMSVVGPRPVTKEELPRYGKAVDEYLRARPGITGLWQVSGRNNLSFDQRVKIDQSYVREWSFVKDFRIILRTVEVLLVRRGAY